MFFQFLFCYLLINILSGFQVTTIGLPTVVMVAAPPPLILGGGGLKISDQINWGAPEQKIKFGGGELNFMGGLSLLYKTPKSGNGIKMSDK